MARVLPATPLRESRLAKLMKSSRQLLCELDRLNLVDVDLDEFEIGGNPLKSKVRELYGSVNKSLKIKRIKENATVVGKTLHILQPRLFVIWDSLIRDTRDFAGNFEGYWSYLKTAQLGLREVIGDYRSVSHDPEAASTSVEKSIYEDGIKPITKLYDEACWAMVRGWLHFR
jgi:hypothetical protein